MSVTLKLELSDWYSRALDKRIEQLTEERLSEVTWESQDVSVDESTVPNKADYVSQLIKADLKSGNLRPPTRGDDE